MYHANIHQYYLIKTRYYCSANSFASEEYKDIEEEIDHMHALVEHLQKEVDVKQEHFRQEMQSLSNHFRDAICVPPMASKV